MNLHEENIFVRNLRDLASCFCKHIAEFAFIRAMPNYQVFISFDKNTLENTCGVVDVKCFQMAQVSTYRAELSFGKIKIES